MGVPSILACLGILQFTGNALSMGSLPSMWVCLGMGSKREPEGNVRTAKGVFLGILLGKGTGHARSGSNPWIVASAP